MAALIRRAAKHDLPDIRALNDIPNVGSTADANGPLPFPRKPTPPASFPDLAERVRFPDVGLRDERIREDARSAVGGTVPHQLPC
jgi:hypothetical protein